MWTSVCPSNHWGASRTWEVTGRLNFTMVQQELGDPIRVLSLPVKVLYKSPSPLISVWGYQTWRVAPQEPLKLYAMLFHAPLLHEEDGELRRTSAQQRHLVDIGCTDLSESRQDPNHRRRTRH
ncbi:hypothetical protein GDO81_025687 [Engystomops pustulosus]|uniref:Uncharacterized protein n=1 Tax=Engystomops pustulosus TaxID=76066 RepID=A0AAV6ZG20_ENGPU|nr:hypothetical protein GDO81_025687 [Engystomops pustulosus]